MHLSESTRLLKYIASEKAAAIFLVTMWKNSKRRNMNDP
jgi:hypothetical protein